MNKVSFSALLGALLVLGGCSLAPEYQRPDSPVAAQLPTGAAYAQDAAATSPATALACVSASARARVSAFWRARSALIQGLFLGALGLGVLGNTAYRVLVQQQPEAELMGLFAVIALVVNVVAVLPLLPHRTGDANVRAVWLFSRNDAIGNAAVVVAAGLVAWTASPWPDLVVAVVIAGLFLQSSWSIIRDARADLREAAPVTGAKA